MPLLLNLIAPFGANDHPQSQNDCEYAETEVNSFDRPYSNGTPGICFAVRIVRLVFTLATFGAGVSLLVKNS